MKILELEIDGIYMFKNNKFKFYTTRNSKNIYRKTKKHYPNSKIYPKDVNIIVGSNSSGKTTLSKSILLIERILSGFQISKEEIQALNDEFSLKIKYLKNWREKQDIVFEYIIQVKDGNISEQLSAVNFKSDETIGKKFMQKGKQYLKYEKLNIISKEEFIYDRENGFQSKIMNYDSDFKNYEIIKVAKNIGYIFTHVEYGNDYHVTPSSKIPQNILEDFLKTIDQSIETVEYTKQDKNDFYISFRNGEELLVDHLNLKNSGKRLSYGTVEAIIFLFKIFEIMQGKYNTVYFDEELSHMHSELEKHLLLALISNIPEKSQLFFTTHNIELLKLKLPISCYTIMSEDENGNAINKHVEEFIDNKNDRNEIYKYISNNYFNTEKSYDNIYGLIKRMNQDN